MNAKVVRKYDNVLQAHMDAQLLRNEGIECEVAEDTSFNCMLPGSARLIVLEDVFEKAKEILSK